MRDPLRRHAAHRETTVPCLERAPNIHVVTARAVRLPQTSMETNSREPLFGKLVADGILKSAVLDSQPADDQLTVTVTGAREVSAAARIWLGAMAGPNGLDPSVQLRDAKVDQLVMSFDVEGTSASHPLSSEAGLDDATREAANEIVKGLR